ncbi:MAG: TetR family transcriptional regulator [Rhodococcus sp. (in: high G+C Gram-positive bacteria)]|nr:TetR family transcriptional regulator [Rhodococcus sp. (in: high G+C Gram-positive bacteria)]
MTQQRAINTRSEIIAAAAQEFAEHGYAAASINNIIDNSTRTKGALYFHFSSKQALAQAVLEQVRSLYTPIVERWRNAPVHPFDAISGIVHDIAAQASNVLMRADARLAVDQPSTELERPSSVWEAAIGDLAVRAESAGYLCGDFTAERFTRFLVATLAGHRMLAEMVPATTHQPDHALHFADTVETLIRAATAQQHTRAQSAAGERAAFATAGIKGEVTAQ